MRMPKSLTAAVQRMEFTQRTPAEVSWGAQEDDWQAEAWEMYQTVGELSAVCRWMGSSASRVTLFAAEVDETSGRADTPTEQPDAVDLVQDMAGGSSGQSDMLRQAAVLLTVVGEFYVAILTNEETGEETWKIIPADRVRQDYSGRWVVTIDGEDREINEEDESLFRVWDRDPHHPERATSSVRAALPVLREIVAMDRLIQAVSRSRVAGNGLLIIPQEANIPSSDGPSGGSVPGVPGSVKVQGQDSANNLSSTLSKVMKRAIDDPGSSSAVTPIVVSTPGEYVDSFKHLRLDTDLTQTALDTREKAIRRLALSLDIPPEVLTGLGDSTHWNAALVDEASLRQHIAPMMATICEAMTEAVLHPLLADVPGVAGIENIVVGFDMSALAQKQDNSQNALAAYREGIIGPNSLRRELGFGDDDKPEEQGEDDRLRSLAERMVGQAPSLFPYLAQVLGFPASTVAPTQQEQAPQIVEVPRNIGGTP